MTGPVINLMRTTVLLFHPKQIFHPLFPPQWVEILFEGGLLFDASVFTHFDSGHNDTFGQWKTVQYWQVVHYLTVIYEMNCQIGHKNWLTI